jgi:hypothetical protein
MRHLRFRKYTESIWAYNELFWSFFQGTLGDTQKYTRDRDPGDTFGLIIATFMIGIPLVTVAISIAIAAIGAVFEAIKIMWIASLCIWIIKSLIILVLSGYAIIFSLFLIWPCLILFYATVRSLLDHSGLFSRRDSYILRKYPNKPENLINGSIFGFIDNSLILNSDNQFVLETKNIFNHTVELVDVSSRHVKFKLRPSGANKDLHEWLKSCGHNVVSLGSSNYTCSKSFFLNYYNFTGEYAYDYV